nr:MAG TPA: hypothetical protein [Bacteriophage sp.]
MKISKRQLISDLNYLLIRLDKKYSINSGGCCLIAFIIARLLKKVNIPFSLKIYSSWDLNESTISKEISSKIINYEEENSCTGENTCNHYSLLTPFGEINPDDGSSIIIKNVSYNDIQWIYKNGMWNDGFDLDNSKLIIKIIKLFFYDKARRLD